MITIPEISTGQQDKIHDLLENIDLQVARGMKKYSVPGLSMCLVHNGWDFIRNYGFADCSGKKPVSENCVFQVASISKSLSAWGVMKLAEEKVINLDSPVGDYLVRWHFPKSEYESSRVTIKSLLNHTAGISVKGYAGYRAINKIPTLEESLTSKKNPFKKVKIINNPGEVFTYSGGGYTILQLLIEEVTGISFNEYMVKEILMPLGMLNSSFEWSNNISNNICKPYGMLGNSIPQYYYAEKAAAGLYSNVTDLVKFIYANMDAYKGNKITQNVLGPESVKLMHYREHRNIFYGLGYVVRTLGKSKLIMHTGYNRGWSSMFAMFPLKGEALVMLTNSSNGRSVIADIFNLWLEAIIGPLSAFNYKSLYLNEVRVPFLLHVKDVLRVLKAD